MKPIWKNILLVVVGLISSVLVGTAWWVLWMNHGWPGSPGFLAKLLNADGEGAYDAIQTEMILIAGMVLFAPWMFFRLRHCLSLSVEKDNASKKQE